MYVYNFVSYYSRILRALRHMSGDRCRLIVTRHVVAQLCRICQATLKGNSLFCADFSGDTSLTTLPRSSSYHINLIFTGTKSLSIPVFVCPLARHTLS